MFLIVPFDSVRIQSQTEAMVVGDILCSSEFMDIQETTGFHHSPAKGVPWNIVECTRIMLTCRWLHTRAIRGEWLPKLMQSQNQVSILHSFLCNQGHLNRTVCIPIVLRRNVEFKCRHVVEEASRIGSWATARLRVSQYGLLRLASLGGSMLATGYEFQDWGDMEHHNARIANAQNHMLDTLGAKYSFRLRHEELTDDYYWPSVLHALCFLEATAIPTRLLCNRVFCIDVLKRIPSRHRGIDPYIRAFFECFDESEVRGSFHCVMLMLRLGIRRIAVSPNLRESRTFAISAVTLRAQMICEVSDSLRHDDELCRIVAMRHPADLGSTIGQDFFDRHPNLAAHVVRRFAVFTSPSPRDVHLRDGISFAISYELRHNTDFLRDVFDGMSSKLHVKRACGALCRGMRKDGPKNGFNDLPSATIAVGAHQCAMEYVSYPALFETNDIVKLAASNAMCIKYLRHKLTDHPGSPTEHARYKNAVLAAVSHRGVTLRYAGYLANDQEIVTAALRNTDLARRYIGASLATLE